MTLPVTEHSMQVVPRSIPTGSGAQSRVLALHWGFRNGGSAQEFLGDSFPRNMRFLNKVACFIDIHKLYLLNNKMSLDMEDKCKIIKLRKRS